MSYNYLTQFDSPNYTPASQTRAVWGRDRKVEAIAIHWWGDPKNNPSFEGIVNYLCRANGSSSAHYIATGTDRRVACIVAPGDNAWATNSANPTTIAIECDPRCRPEDYDVVAELIADIRDTYGDIPLVPHKQFVATACPGNYDLGRLDREARNKIATAVQGQVRNKVEPVAKVTKAQADTLYRELLGRGIDASGETSYVGRQTLEQLRTILLASTERSQYVNRVAAEQAAKVEAAKKEAEARAKREAETEALRISEEKRAQEAAKKAAEEAAAKNYGYTEADRQRDNGIAAVVQWIKELLTKIFK